MDLEYKVQKLEGQIKELQRRLDLQTGALGRFVGQSGRVINTNPPRRFFAQITDVATVTYADLTTRNWYSWQRIGLDIPPAVSLSPNDQPYPAGFPIDGNPPYLSTPYPLGSLETGLHNATELNNVLFAVNDLVEIAESGLDDNIWYCFKPLKSSLAVFSGASVSFGVKSYSATSFLTPLSAGNFDTDGYRQSGAPDFIRIPFDGYYVFGFDIVVGWNTIVGDPTNIQIEMAGSAIGANAVINLTSGLIPSGFTVLTAAYMGFLTKGSTIVFTMLLTGGTGNITIGSLDAFSGAYIFKVGNP